MGLLDLQPVNGEQQQLTAAQTAQLNADMRQFLPADFPNKTATRLQARQTAEVSDKYIPAQMPSRSYWRMRKFPMGGWVYHDVPYRWQRTDQGQDFEIPLGRHIIAPGWGHCIAHLSDANFPNGFGSPYAVVYIGSGKFHDEPIRHGASPFWYLGHDNYVQIRAGESFHTGRILAQTDHSLNAGWGWSEIGWAPNGYPGGMGNGDRWRYLFSPVWRWSA